MAQAEACRPSAPEGRASRPRGREAEQTPDRLCAFAELLPIAIRRIGIPNAARRTALAPLRLVSDAERNGSGDDTPGVLGDDAAVRESTNARADRRIRATRRVHQADAVARPPFRSALAAANARRLLARSAARGAIGRRAALASRAPSRRPAAPRGRGTGAAGSSRASLHPPQPRELVSIPAAEWQFRASPVQLGSNPHRRRCTLPPSRRGGCCPTQYTTCAL